MQSARDGGCVDVESTEHTRDFSGRDRRVQRRCRLLMATVFFMPTGLFLPPIHGQFVRLLILIRALAPSINGRAHLVEIQVNAVPDH